MLFPFRTSNASEAYASSIVECIQFFQCKVKLRNTQIAPKPKFVFGASLILYESNIFALNVGRPTPNPKEREKKTSNKNIVVIVSVIIEIKRVTNQIKMSVPSYNMRYATFGTYKKRGKTAVHGGI